jgi:4-hydroxy-2-oxoheptanedioate aldolase
MIETKEGIDNLESILSVDGVDGIYVGPADLSHALGLPPRMDNDDPLHVATVNHILEACKRHGVAAGIHTGGPAFSADAIKRGFQFVALTSDANCMTRAAQQQLRELKDLTGLGFGAAEKSAVY